jgi:hypothetical protein
MSAAIAIEPQREAGQGLRQKAEFGAQFSPQVHQLEIGDVTIGEGKHEVCAIIRVKTDGRMAGRPDGLHRHGYFGPVPPLLERLDYVRIIDLQFPDPPQCVPYNRALGGELRIVRDMLELTAAAVIVHVMRARWFDALGTGLQDFPEVGARELAVPFE